MNQFYQGLKESIKDAITYFSVDLSDYDELKEQAQQLNQQIMRCNAEASPQAAAFYSLNCASAAFYLSNCASAASAAYTSALFRPAVASAACASVFSPSAFCAFYTAFFSLHDPLTEDEKVYHCVNHLCLYCEKSEHIASVCLI